MSECINFDLERMKSAVNSPGVRVPKGLSEGEFIEWIKSEAKKQVIILDKRNPV